MKESRRSRAFADAARKYLARYGRQGLITQINSANGDGPTALERRHSKALRRYLVKNSKNDPW